MKVLIIDDSAFERGIVKELLSKAGFTEFIDARSGEEGLEKFRDERPDLVLLDLIMPGMSGIEVLREIRRQEPQAKVVIISMTSDAEMKAQALELGADAYITKPLDEGLIQSVKELAG